MNKKNFLFLAVFFAPFPAMAFDFEVNFNNLIGPPHIITYQSEAHAVFDFGGMKYLFKVSEEAKSYPQCDAVQEKTNELMVVGNNPEGYAYFVEKAPVAFKTKHNVHWQTTVKKLNGSGK